MERATKTQTMDQIESRASKSCDLNGSISDIKDHTQAQQCGMISPVQ